MNKREEKERRRRKVTSAMSKREFLKCKKKLRKLRDFLRYRNNSIQQNFASICEGKDTGVRKSANAEITDSVITHVQKIDSRAFLTSTNFAEKFHKARNEKQKEKSR